MAGVYNKPLPPRAMYPRGACFSGGLHIYPGASLIRYVTLCLSISVFNLKLPEINPGRFILSSDIPYNPDPENERGLTVLLAWRGVVIVHSVAICVNCFPGEDPSR